MRTLLISALLSALIIATGCVRERGEPIFEREIAENPYYGVVLGFDLRNDATPVAGLLIREVTDANKPIQRREIIMPFGTSSAKGPKDLWVTWGSSNSHTIVSYRRSPEIAGNYTVSLWPVFEQDPRVASSILYPGSLSGGVYLIRRDQERFFIYVYGDIPGNENYHLLVNPPFTDVPDAIAVALPMGATVEIRGGRIHLPVEIYNNGISSFYSSSAKAASNKAGYLVERLELNYIVPLSDRQKMLKDLALKLGAAIVSPILGLIFLDNKQARRRRARRVAILSGIIVEIAAIGWILIAAWSLPETARFEVIYSLVFVIIGAVLTGVTLWIKRSSQ